ncbi:enoyl-CoA hydratase/isomerase family protein [Palleronia pontilimi]|uniref:enoyl-CoA hydratase/isomerase family protein n=1 Tax=Palleronia pontilimi TaxID=1964209 RepID=UPI001F312B24|nr:enoyl-CoA hydratase/isomerase family protein [Palleronia pontilimi]
MTDTDIRIKGRAGRITLNRPAALNALTHAQCLEIEAAIDGWARDDAVALVVIDAVGEKAFCAGGDITSIYEDAKAGNLDAPRGFWRDEYRLNAKLATYPKPIVTMMQGFTMGGGVGLGCHASHRVVCENSRIAMPECGIGLVPDVGGSLLLARAPGHAGEYLGTTAYRMGPADALWARFADTFVPRTDWAGAIATLEDSGSPTILSELSARPGDSALARLSGDIDTHFAGASLHEILASLNAADTPFALKTIDALGKVSPLSACVTIDLVRDVRGAGTIEHALAMEYRATHRAIPMGDLVEGIRAAVIDKDRAPKWKHAGIADVTQAEIDAMLAPLGAPFD